MTWANQPGKDPDLRFTDLEKTFGIQNLTDVQIDEDAGYLYLFTNKKKFKITITEVL